MTLVHFHLTDAEGRGLDGSVSLVPTRRVTVADAIRLRSRRPSGLRRARPRRR